MSKLLTPAVGYIRMSSDLQEASPAQQRKAIIELAAKHGYSITRWYEDLGISGDATEKRKGFLQMIHDAEEKGDFAAILCWDQDRFGRFDSIEAGRWIHPLRCAGVWLVTVAQGQIDWNDFTSRMMYSITQEGKHQFLIDLSRNVLRGRLQSAKKGTLLFNPAYGYDRLFYDEKGRLARRVPYGEKFSKPNGWVGKLAPAENTEEQSIVKWMFDTFANSDCSLRHIVCELNKRNTQTRRGSPWNAVSLHYMLTNPVYLGYAVVGKKRAGKYHQISDSGEIDKAKKSGGFRSAPIIVKNIHEPLVEKVTFDRVQAKLKTRSRTNTKPRDSGYLLSGIVRCGHCGKPMAGKCDGKKGNRYYYCPGIHNGTCKCYSVRQDIMDEYVMSIADKWINTDESLKIIEKSLHKMDKAKPKFQDGAKTLKAKIDTLDRKIAKGNENILLADSDAIPELSILLASWRKERSIVQEELESIAENPTGKPRQDAIKRALAKLERIRKLYTSANHLHVRAALKEVIESVELWWEHKSPRYRRIARGVLTWKTIEEVMKNNIGKTGQPPTT